MRKLTFHTILPSHQRRRKSKDGQVRTHHHHIQVDQSHPEKDVQDVNIARARNVNAIIPLPAHQFRLPQIDLHHRFPSILHLAEDFKS